MPSESPRRIRPRAVSWNGFTGGGSFNFGGVGIADKFLTGSPHSVNAADDNEMPDAWREFCRERERVQAIDNFCAVGMFWFTL
jgi:hypothetical protein